MQKYLEILTQMFLEEVEEHDNRSWQHKDQGITLYSKDIPTFRIASRMGVKTDKARRELKKLEVLGYVKANRSHNNSTRWSVVTIPGFKQHKYADYYCRE